LSLVRLSRPQAADLVAVRQAAATQDFSYDVGILSGRPAPGMAVDTLEVVLGSGDQAWERAKAAISSWAPFDLGWVSIETGGTAPEPRLDVVVHAVVCGLHFTPACRVISVHDLRDGAAARFGFTYGSLQRHVEIGEELFEVAHSADGRVMYRIEVMARPGRWYARLGKPLADRVRSRFRRDSAAAMLRYVAR
jgi:uncharacterized protein (UPF0548 family)